MSSAANSITTPTPLGSDDNAVPSRAKRSSVDPQAILAAAVTAMGGDVREPQQRMLDTVAETVDRNATAIVQAGTGTGKSLAYLCGTADATGPVVVATATKQLSDQLHDIDIPMLTAAYDTITNESLAAAVLKGRANYACLSKLDELDRLEAGDQSQDDDDDDEDALDLGDLVSTAGRRPSKKDLKQLASVRAWVGKTRTGDRAEAPPVTNQVWAQVSTDAAGCPGARLCVKGSACFAENARRQAAAADVVVVNHALLATDLLSPQPLFAEAAGFVIDEVHEFTSSLSSAWALELNPDKMMAAARQARRRMPDLDVLAEQMTQEVDVFRDTLAAIPPGRLTETPDDLTSIIQSMSGTADTIARRMTAVADNPETPRSKRIQISKTARTFTDIASALSVALIGSADEWVQHIDGRGDRPVTLTMTPLRPGPRFHALRGQRWLVATSATAAIGSDFAPTASGLGLDDHDYLAVDVGTPFSWDTQALLYVPDRTFPEPVGKDRTAHSEAFLKEAEALVTAAGGRSLVLCTTVKGALAAAAHLRDTLPDGITVLAHGDAPASTLADQFAADETSVLCATMGMWAGLSVPGPSCTAVIIDKIPFPPMDDPVFAARKEWADVHNGNGFTQVYVHHAALLLAQAAGRLIRTTEDKGVVAICDRRLVTKGYGRTLMAALPPMRLFHDREVVNSALTRLAK